MRPRPPALVLGLALAAGGCAWFGLPRPATVMLTRADRLLESREYEGAVRVYDEFLERFAEDPAAARARASLESLAALLAARAEIARLRDILATRESEMRRLREQVARREEEVGRRDEELVRRGGELTRRDGELTRARQELQRLAAEAERLRGDIEELKRVDIRLERRR
jgi:chromosome segregation ATPase